MGVCFRTIDYNFKVVFVLFGSVCFVFSTFKCVIMGICLSFKTGFILHCHQKPIFLASINGIGRDEEGALLHM